jgi:Protein of unknown function (DUF3052)
VFIATRDRPARGGKPIGASSVTAGYSGRPQSAKLGLKPGQHVELHHPPPGWAPTDPPAGLSGLPGGADGLPGGQADVIIAFFTQADDIAEQIADLARRIYPAGALWVAWPRRAAGHRSDITDNVIRAHALPVGLVDVKVAAIDDDWSGLRVVWRTENR